MIGILDAGGGLRAAFGAGVLDGCLERGIAFDYGIGVSAGAANLCSFQAGQHGRNLPFYRDYSQRSDYLGLAAVRHSHSLLDLDYIYGTLSNEGGENPLDYAALTANPAQLKIVATEALTGCAHYFDKSEIEENNYGILKASCCLPVVCRAARWQGVQYFDGGLSDPIPFQKAFDDGCDRVVAILTRPHGWRMQPGNREERAGRPMRLRYPAVGMLLQSRSQMYNSAVAALEREAAAGRAYIVAPDDSCGIGVLTKDPPNIERLYEKGRAAAAEIADYLAKGASPVRDA